LKLVSLNVQEFKIIFYNTYNHGAIDKVDIKILFLDLSILLL